MKKTRREPTRVSRYPPKKKRLCTRAANVQLTRPDYFSSLFKPTVIRSKTYYWCSCGRSQKQPFCDGSHKGE